MFELKQKEKPLVQNDKWAESWAELRLQCAAIAGMNQDSHPMEAYRQVAKLVNQAMRARFFLLTKYFPEG